MTSPSPRPLPAPLSDPLRGFRWHFRLEIGVGILGAAALAVAVLTTPGLDRTPSLLLWGGALMGIAAVYVYASWRASRILVPRRGPDFLYLRAFRSDAASVGLKARLQVLLGPGLRLAGIRQPERRMPVVLRSLLSPILMLRYAHPRYMGLEAGADWAPRLWRSLADARGAFLDLRDATEAVEREVRLCDAALGPERVAFLVNEGNSEAACRDTLRRILGERSDRVDRYVLIPCPTESSVRDEDFVRATRAFLARVPGEAAGIAPGAWAVAAEVAPTPGRLVRERIGRALLLVVGALLVVVLRGGAAQFSAEAGALGIASLTSSALLLLLSLLPPVAAFAYTQYLRVVRDVARPLDAAYSALASRSIWALWAHSLMPLALGVIATGVAFVGPDVFGDLVRSDKEAARAQMSALASAVDGYYLEHRKLPQSLESLRGEDERGGGAWLGGIPNDPWGEPYDYVVAGRKRFTIRSGGPDRQIGTEDDLTWPAEGSIPESPPAAEVRQGPLDPAVGASPAPPAEVPARGESSRVAAHPVTDARIRKVSAAAEAVRRAWSRYPPATVAAIGSVAGRAPRMRRGSNRTNEGAEALYQSMYWPGVEHDPGLSEEELSNTDEDELAEAAGRGVSLSEVRDEWGNPLVYIPATEYGRAETEPLRYRLASGDEVEVRPWKVDGAFANPSSFQLFSMGPDSLPNTEDDIVGR